jgi:uncharacterized membrane protein (DUF2068 family)
MRPLGVSLVAVFNWLRAGLFTLGGLVLILVGHLSGRLAAMIGSGPLLERVLSAVGKTLGFAALLIAVAWLAAGVGLWTLKTWGRSLTLALTGLWLFFGLFGLIHRPFPTHILRVIIDAVILVYLMNPAVQRIFT